MRHFALALLLCDAAAAETLSIRRVAVLQFETPHLGASGLTASDLISVNLQRYFPGLSIVERTRLEKILSEQHLKTSGLVDSRTAARLQSLLGVDSIVIGRIVALDLEPQGGSGSLMMTARLVDTTTGRILWAETRTVRVQPPFFKRLSRSLSDTRGESDALVTSRLLEKAAFELVQDLGARLSSRALDPDHARAGAEAKAAARAPAREDGEACEDADRSITSLGRSILSDEALYWAHRMKSERALGAIPGEGYKDDDLRKRLGTKILFWLGEERLPPLSKRQADRVVEAKGKMKELLSRCGRGSEVASLIGPPSPGRLR